jgi:hypothetical protein
MVGIALAVIEHNEAQPAFVSRCSAAAGAALAPGNYQNYLLHIYPLSLMGRIDRTHTDQAMRHVPSEPLTDAAAHDPFPVFIRGATEFLRQTL